MVFSLNLIKVIFWFLFWKTLKVVNKIKANNFEGVRKAIDTISVVLLLKISVDFRCELSDSLKDFGTTT